MIRRAVFAGASVFALVACSKDEHHPAFASGTCDNPCGTPLYHGTGSPPPALDAGVDAGVDASDSGP